MTSVKLLTVNAGKNVGHHLSVVFRKQLLADVLQNAESEMFQRISRKTSMVELFSLKLQVYFCLKVLIPF